MTFTFSKAEKLKSRKVIERLFEEGKSLKKFPLKAIYLKVEQQNKIQAAFSVPKRRFKLAVTRNRIKRQMREAYRLHKPQVANHNGTAFVVLFIYIHNKKVEYQFIEESMKHLLKHLPYENH